MTVMERIKATNHDELEPFSECVPVILALVLFLNLSNRIAI